MIIKFVFGFEIPMVGNHEITLSFAQDLLDGRKEMLKFAFGMAGVPFEPFVCTLAEKR